MIAQYDKVIVIKEGDTKKAVVIFDESLHLPVFFEMEKCGMDEILGLINSDKGIIQDEKKG